MSELTLGVHLSNRVARVAVDDRGPARTRRLRPAQSERVRLVWSTLAAGAVAIGAARVAARPPS